MGCNSSESLQPQIRAEPARGRPQLTFHVSEAGYASHIVKGTPTKPPWPKGMREATFGMGCFWCAEALFMHLEGVYSTQVGYAGGETKAPTYQEVCTGSTGHNEVCRVVFDPKVVSYDSLLRLFWEGHDPTTPNRQGPDDGTQYRSGIYCYSKEHARLAHASKGEYQTALSDRGIAAIICTEIVHPAPVFHYAEASHQQYDAQPGTRSYAGLQPTGVRFGVGSFVPDDPVLSLIYSDIYVGILEIAVPPTSVPGPMLVSPSTA